MIAPNTMTKKLVLLVSLFIFSVSVFAQPVINSFSPVSGPVGTIVTLSGANFNPVASDNIVYFGAVKAAVINATSTSVTISVPAGASYQPISVTANNLTGYSKKPFVVTFAGGGDITPASLSPSPNFTTDLHPNGMVISDLDGDGKPDVATANNYVIAGSQASVSVLRNTGTPGAVSFSPKMDFAIGSLTYAIAAGDLDGDGKPELVATSITSKTVSVFRNVSTPGNISFALRVDYTTEDNPYSVAISDLDGDGRPDLAVANYLSGTISIYKNTSSTGVISFAARTNITTAIGPFCVVAGDMDGDGRPELTVTNNLSGNLSIFRNTSAPGTISFASKMDYAVGTNPRGIAMGDLDLDGKLDLVVAHEGDVSSVRVMQNTSSMGAVSFTVAASMKAGATSYHVAINDLNGDGLPDLAVATSETIAVLQNTSVANTITFNTKIDLWGASPYFPAIGDLDGDGKADLAVTNFTSDNISVYRNRITEPVIGAFSPRTATTGATITIIGTNLSDVTKVSFGGVPATSFTIVSPTSITAIVGAGASGALSVSSPLGTASLDGFTYLAPPSITSFSPAAVGAGQEVMIGGNDFIDVTSVTFGGSPATSFIVNSTTSVTAVVGSGATGDITVTTPYGTATKAGFTFVPAPVITSFTPDTADEGTSVTISGTHLAGATAVSFGNIAASSFVINSDHSITALVGVGASGKVSVTTAGGTTSRDGFIFVRKPTIVSVSPTMAGEGTLVTITGTNFNDESNMSGAVTAVTFGETPAFAFSVYSNTTIIAVVGPGSSGSVSITTPDGTATFEGFTFVPTPVITSFAPVFANTGETVTIVGNNFTGVTAVSFGGVAATSFTVHSATSITAVVGDGASGNVLITTVGGTVKANGFTHTRPTISSFSPERVGAGTTVTITGSNFTGASAVYFGTVPATSFTVESPTSMVAIVPAEADRRATISITTPEGTATSASPYVFTDPPKITSFSPTIGGAGTLVHVMGTDLGWAGAMVSFGGVVGKVMGYGYDDELITMVGSGASGDVSVTTDYGTSSLPGFTFVQAPVINSFTPSSGHAGTVVTITGTGFELATAVRFGGVDASSFTIVSSSTIEAVVGAGTSGPVTVTTPGGTASIAGFEFTGPEINSFSPTMAGSGAVITIMGRNFANTEAVSIGGVRCPSVTVVSPSVLRAVVASTGASGNVSVTTPLGTAIKEGFTFSTTIPVITSFAPMEGVVGSAVTITGSNFHRLAVNNIVYFGPVAASVTAATENMLTVKVPAGATNNPITVTVNGLTAYSVKSFVVTFPQSHSLSSNSFVATSKMATGYGTWDVSLQADIDGDGKIDLTAVSNGRVSGYRNLSTPGTFSFAVKTHFGGVHLSQISSADMNGDGKLDLAVASSTDGLAVSIFRNTSFATALSMVNDIDLNSRIGDFRAAIADMDRDGRPDVASVGRFYWILSTFRNMSLNDKVIFGDQKDFMSRVDRYPLGIVAGDLDTDEKPDLIIYHISGWYNRTGLSVLKNTSTAGSISFGSEIPNLLSTKNDPSFIKLGDVDRDGRPDAIVVNGNLLSVFINTSVRDTISFAPSVDIETETSPNAVTIVDADGDGKLDLVTANGAANTISIFRNNSTGRTMSFEPGIRYSVLNGAYGVQTGDLDNDGRPDIITVNSSYDSVTMIRNQVSGGCAITSFTPAVASTGTVVTIKGTHFTGATSVHLGDSAAASFTVVSDTVITAVVGGGATGNIRVVTPVGIAFRADFKFVSLPSITSFSPTSAGPVETVIITGANFTGATGVSFGGVPASTFIIASSTTIIATVSTGASGNITVTTPDGTATVEGFVYSLITGAEDPDKNNSDELILSPNPADAIARVHHPASTKDTELRWIDMSGRVVVAITIEPNTTQTEVNVMTLSPGIYKMIWSDGKRRLGRTVMIY
jgi:hypothetical protein